MQEKEVIITHETPVAEIERYARIIGETLKPRFAAKDYAHAFSDLMHLNVISILSDASMTLKLPLSQMTDSRKHVMRWMNAMPVMRALMIAIPNWTELDMRILTDAPIVKTHSREELEALPERISTDTYIFLMLAIWHGATPECKRRILNNKATRTLDRLKKKVGINGILSMMWMAATEYVLLGEKVFAPAWERMTSGRDERSINSMGTHACDKLSRKRVVSSFADLVMLKDKKKC